MNLVRLPDQPDVSHHTEDGVYIKQIHFPKAGIVMGQHSHAHGHAFMVAVGELRIWVDGVQAGDYKQGQCLHIAAGRKHTMMSVVDNTLGYCIHNLHGKEEVEILEHAEFPG